MSKEETPDGKESCAKRESHETKVNNNQMSDFLFIESIRCPQSHLETCLVCSKIQRQSNFQSVCSPCDRNCVYSFGQNICTLEKDISLQGPFELRPFVECWTGCTCENTCQNRVVQMGVSVDLCVKPVKQKGLGVFALEAIPKVLIREGIARVLCVYIYLFSFFWVSSPPFFLSLAKGKFVCEYAGELISTLQAKERIEEFQNQLKDVISSFQNPNKKRRTSYQDKPDKPTPCNYLLSLKEHFPSVILRTNIDARHMGNISRFINHSCNPNLDVVAVRIGPCPIPHVSFFANKEILVGEELTFHYGTTSSDADSSENFRIPCLCGNVNCVGYLPLDNS